MFDWRDYIYPDFSNLDLAKPDHQSLVRDFVRTMDLMARIPELRQSMIDNYEAQGLVEFSFDKKIPRLNEAIPMYSEAIEEPINESFFQSAYSKDGTNYKATININSGDLGYVALLRIIGHETRHGPETDTVLHGKLMTDNFRILDEYGERYVSLFDEVLAASNPEFEDSVDEAYVNLFEAVWYFPEKTGEGERGMYAPNLEPLNLVLSEAYGLSKEQVLPIIQSNEVPGGKSFFSANVYDVQAVIETLNQQTGKSFTYPDIAMPLTDQLLESVFEVAKNNSNVSDELVVDATTVYGLLLYEKSAGLFGLSNEDNVVAYMDTVINDNFSNAITRNSYYNKKVENGVQYTEDDLKPEALEKLHSALVLAPRNEEELAWLRIAYPERHSPSSALTAPFNATGQTVDAVPSEKLLPDIPAIKLPETRY